MKITLRFLLAALLVLTLVGLGSSALAAPSGNADAAHLCQDGGYASLQGSDGTTFSNAGECVSYAAQGGTIVGINACVVTSTTGCLTLDNVTLQSGSANGDTMTVTGSISFKTACPYTPPANGICYMSG
ncbi:MAG TPA: hypothetical protein VFU72_05490, partial [Nitrolancea sp.]|nr:hypothetical protein [Nitrolancea sp.]